MPTPPPAPPVPPHLPVTGASFNFTLISMKITNTRSRHEDTDFVSFTMQQTSNNKAVTANKTLHKSMGDLNNGTFSINLTFQAVHVQDGDHIAVNYLVVNSGHQKADEVYATLSKAGSNMATAGLAAAGAAIGTAIPIPGLGTALGALGGFLVGQITAIINANCDGPVAAENNVFKLSDLLERTAHGKFTHETKHPGTDSASGCGSNSEYYVTWSIERV